MNKNSIMFLILSVPFFISGTSNAEQIFSPHSLNLEIPSKDVRRLIHEDVRNAISLLSGSELTSKLRGLEIKYENQMAVVYLKNGVGPLKNKGVYYFVKAREKGFDIYPVDKSFSDKELIKAFKKKNKSF